MPLTLDRVADLFDLDRPGRKRRRRRSLFTLRVRAGFDMLEAARRGLEWARGKWRERALAGTAEDPRIEAALSREAVRS